jgi:hypothetical protein
MRVRVDGPMLIRVIGSNFVAGIVLEDDVVVKAAPIVKWAHGLETQELRLALQRRNLKATIVRTLTKAEIEKVEKDGL